MNNIELLKLDTLNLKCFRFRGPHSTCSGSSGSGSWRLGKKNRHSDRRTGKCRKWRKWRKWRLRLGRSRRSLPFLFQALASMRARHWCHWWMSDEAPRSPSLAQILRAFPCDRFSRSSSDLHQSTWSLLAKFCLKMPPVTPDAFRCLQMPSVLILSGLNNSFHCSVVCLIFACKADRVVAESWREVTKGLVTTIQNDPTDPESGKVETLPELSFGPV